MACATERRECSVPSTNAASRQQYRANAALDFADTVTSSTADSRSATVDGSGTGACSRTACTVEPPSQKNLTPVGRGMDFPGQSRRVLLPGTGPLKSISELGVSKCAAG